MAKKYFMLKMVQTARTTFLGFGMLGLLCIGMIVDCPNWGAVWLATIILMIYTFIGVGIDFLIGKGIIYKNLDYATLFDWNYWVLEREHTAGHTKYYKWIERYQLKDTDRNFEFFCRRYVRKPIVKA